MTAGDNNQHVSIEDLSAYADNEALTHEQRVSIEHHLSGCHACRDELTSLQTVSALLADLPAVEAPRSFRLTPADVRMDAPPAPEPIPIEPWIIRNQSRFRWAGLAAAVLLVMVISADLLVRTGQDDAADFALMQDSAEESAPAEADLDEESSIMSVDESEEADESFSEEETEVAEEPATEEAAPETEGADEPASEEAAPDAALDGELADDDEFSVAEDAPEPEEDRQDSPAMDSAPDDVGDADRADPPVADSAVEEELARMQASEESDDGLSFLQWTGGALAVVAATLLAAGFLLPRVWSATSRS